MISMRTWLLISSRHYEKNTRKSSAKAALARQAEGIDLLAELAALKAMTVPELQAKWRGSRDGCSTETKSQSGIA